MKETKLQIRMKEGELEELKQKANIYGMKNVSELVRTAIDLLTEVSDKSESAEDYVKTCNSSSMLWLAKFICNEFDIQEYLKKENPEKEELDKILLDLYNKGTFESLKKAVLKSILDDLSFNNKPNKETEKILKEILVKYIGK